MKSRGRDIDQLLPIAMGRTAAGLLAGGSVPDVLQQVGESLEMKKTNPLTPELILTALEIRIKDRVEALRSLASRRSSVSLANLAQLLEGYTEAGGCLILIPIYLSQDHFGFTPNGSQVVFRCENV